MLRDVLMIPRIEQNQLEVDSDKGGELSASAHEISESQLKEIRSLIGDDRERMQKIERQCQERYGKPISQIRSTVADRLIQHLRTAEPEKGKE